MTPQRTVSAYLASDRLGPGTASSHHVHSILDCMHAEWPSITLVARSEAGVRGIIASLLRQMRCVLDSRRRGLLYVRYHPLLYPVLALAKLVGCPYVVELNGPWSDTIEAFPRLRQLGPVFRHCFVRSVRWASGVIANTSELERYCVEECGARSSTAVIPPGVDPRVFLAHDRDRETPKSRYVCFVGSFARWQGLSELMAAVSDPAWPTGVGLRIAGAGALQSEVERVAAGSDSIVYLGRLSHNDARRLLEGAICSVSAKRYQTDHSLPQTGLSPLKVIESMALGTPIVVSDIPDQSVMVRHWGAGEVIGEVTPQSIAKAVSKIVAQPWLYSIDRSAVMAAVSADTRGAETVRFLKAVVENRCSRRGQRGKVPAAVGRGAGSAAR